MQSQVLYDPHKIPPGCIECPECLGSKVGVYSCCTGNPVYNESMMCPVCKEHLGEEDCTNCEGRGFIENEINDLYE